MAKSKEHMEFRERLNIMRRSLKLLDECDKGGLRREIAYDFLLNITGYVAAYITASIVDAIDRQKPLKEQLVFAACIIGVQLLLHIGAVIIKRWNNCNDFTRKSNLQKKLWEKVMSMDYTRMEDTKTQDHYNNAKRHYGNNMGLMSLYYSLSYAVIGAFMIVAGIIVIAPIALKKAVVHDGFIGFVQSPAGLVTMIVIVAAVEIFKTICIDKKIVHIWEKTQGSDELTLTRRVLNTYQGVVLDNYRNGKDFRIYDETDLILSKMDENHKIQIEGWRKCFRQSIPYNFIFQMLNTISRMLMYGFAVVRAITGMLSPGEVIAFALYFTNLQAGISNLSEGIGMVNTTPPFCKKVLDFLDISDEKYMGTIPTEKRTDNEYEFEFKHVWFKYPGCENYTLKDINLKWKIGEKMALVGRNGCGKSTLVKLLCRLYDPTEGEITLNGIDIRKYDYADYMALFSVVFQDSHLFSFSVAENVAASTEYDAERVMKCVKRAGLAERLETMPHGIDTCLYKDFDPKGVEISGGEEQKLCLARAIYKGAPFIVLDEPTAALDPISEHDIYTKFNSIVGTRTAIYISHRLSSCHFCDEITVMENGRIAERGSHESLLEQQGVYQELWTAQAEYYKVTTGELYA